MNTTTAGEAMTDVFDADAKLIELERRLQAVETESEQPHTELGEAEGHDFKQDPRILAVVDAARTTIKEIIGTSAHTARGVLVKARMMHAEVEYGPTAHTKAVVESLIADLERVVRQD